MGMLPPPDIGGPWMSLHSEVCPGDSPDPKGHPRSPRSASLPFREPQDSGPLPAMELEPLPLEGSRAPGAPTLRRPLVSPRSVPLSCTAPAAPLPLSPLRPSSPPTSSGLCPCKVSIPSPSDRDPT